MKNIINKNKNENENVEYENRINAFNKLDKMNFDIKKDIDYKYGLRDSVALFYLSTTFTSTCGYGIVILCLSSAGFIWSLMLMRQSR